jgi:hypothetical protein
MSQLLSDEMRTTAAALRRVRDHVVRLIAAGRLPSGGFVDFSTVLVSGLDVAEALDRLAGDVLPAGTPEPDPKPQAQLPLPRPGTGYLDDKR